MYFYKLTESQAGYSESRLPQVPGEMNEGKREKKRDGETFNSNCSQKGSVKQGIVCVCVSYVKE